MRHADLKLKKTDSRHQAAQRQSRSVLQDNRGSVQFLTPLAKTGFFKSQRHGSSDIYQLSSVIQLLSDEDISAARTAARSVEHITIQEVIEWQQRITGWMSEIGLYDPRRKLLEGLYHIFSRQQMMREVNRRHLMTRIISPDQLNRPNIGTNSVRRSSRSLNRNLSTHLAARGRGTTNVKRLYSFMRSFGGAGLQGFHRDPMTRLNVIYRILSRMSQVRHTRSSRGPKFAMVAVDRRRLDQGNIMDTTNPETQRMFLTAYKRFEKMYRTHAGEGVVAVKGDVSVGAVKGLRAFRGVPNKLLLKKIMELLLDLASAEPEPTFRKFRKRDDEDGSGGSGGPGGSGAIPV